MQKNLFLSVDGAGLMEGSAPFYRLHLRPCNRPLKNQSCLHQQKQPPLPSIWRDNYSGSRQNPCATDTLFHLLPAKLLSMSPGKLEKESDSSHHFPALAPAI